MATTSPTRRCCGTLKRIRSRGFGVDDFKLGLTAAGAALYYLGETQGGRVPHVRRVQRYGLGRPHGARPADEVQPSNSSPQCKADVRKARWSASWTRRSRRWAGRLLRKWLVRPLRKVETIEKRLDAVEALFTSRRLRENLRAELGQVGDLERLAAKICTGRAMPRDLVSLKRTLKQVPPVKTLLQDEPCETLCKLAGSLALCQEIVDEIEATLVEEPPAGLGDGGLIRDGFSEELDSLRKLARSGKDWVAQMQQQEAERTGITSLKVGFNKVFGYYLEITNAHKDKVPDDYIRKQTLVNAERYITPDLKEYEEKILTAEEKIAQLEGELFTALRTTVAEATSEMQLNASLLAMLDGFCALAEVADRYDYVRPAVDESAVLEIEDGRHPVVERTLPAGEPFIPEHGSPRS